jgi:hypothetical protein
LFDEESKMNAVISEGIKQTIGEEYHHRGRIDGVIKNGIKEVKGLPDMSGELRGYGDYYRSQKTMAKPHSLYVKDVIENSIKETWGYEKQPQKRIDEVIMNGQKD